MSYINRDKLTDLLQTYHLKSKITTTSWEMVMEAINECEDEGVESVRHGYWIRDGVCSECRAPIAIDSRLDFLDVDDNSYCYSCGAKMDGDTK